MWRQIYSDTEILIIIYILFTAILTFYRNFARRRLILHGALVSSFVRRIRFLDHQLVHSSFVNDLAMIHSTDLLVVVPPFRRHGVRCFTGEFQGLVLVDDDFLLQSLGECYFFHVYRHSGTVRRFSNWIARDTLVIACVYLWIRVSDLQYDVLAIVGFCDVRWFLQGFVVSVEK